MTDVLLCKAHNRMRRMESSPVWYPEDLPGPVKMQGKSWEKLTPDLRHPSCYGYEAGGAFIGAKVFL